MKKESFIKGIESIRHYIPDLDDGISFHKGVTEGFLVSVDKNVYIMSEDASLSYCTYLTIKYLDDVL